MKWIKRGNNYYLDVVSAFDIETSSWHEYKGKVITDKEVSQLDIKEKFEVEHKAIMYLWMMAIEDEIITGRTWDEFIELINTIRVKYKLNHNHRMIIWVHNLAFELEWIKDKFKWINRECFCVDKYKPAKMVCEEGIEFRCSYVYTNKALKDIQLFNSDIHKMTGDLDYSLIRTPETPITDKELNYGIKDVQVVVELIRQDLKKYGHLCDFPLTSTGKLRKKLKENLSDKYYSFVSRLTIDKDEYPVLRKASGGGYAHSAWMHINEVIEDVEHYDENSAYIAAMALYPEYPVSKGKHITKCSQSKWDYYKANKAFVAKVVFKGLKAKFNYEFYLSSSNLENAHYNNRSLDVFNGRVKECLQCETYITNIDLEIIDQVYDYEELGLLDLWVYDKGYLPKEFVDLMLDDYVIKTGYKNTDFKQEYNEAKTNVNSYFGLAAMDIMKHLTTFDGDYEESETSIHSLDIYNYKKRITSYSWAPFITAIARRTLWTGIINYGKDYLYTDTDSLFVNKYDNTYIEDYNSYIVDYLIPKCVSETGLDVNKFIPSDVHGVAHPLGIWEKDHDCRAFKSLGAKRYVILNEDNKIELTCAGVNKVAGSQYLNQWEGMEAMEHFNKDLVFDVEHSGRKVSYRFKNIEGSVVDYLGNSYNYKEAGGISLLNVEYKMDDLSKLLYFIENHTII